MKLIWQKSVMALVAGAVISGSALANSGSSNERDAQSASPQAEHEAPATHQLASSPASQPDIFDVDSYPFKQYHLLISENENLRMNLHARR